MNPELSRIQQSDSPSSAWREWGPYLSERQWGTVREDYSPDGAAWDYLTHEDSRSRAYRWGEDGIFGWSDLDQFLCFSIALWNHRDPILKERLFGLTNDQGNHGEDVKECYHYLAGTPTHSYQRALYKYPQRPFPYQDLIDESARRRKDQPEYELVDTGVFEDDRYFDLFVEYAKSTPQDTAIRLTVCNRGPEVAELVLLPQLWCRNRWAWKPGFERPLIRASEGVLLVESARPGNFQLSYQGEPQILFTENETNEARLFGAKNPTPFVKDAFHEVIVNGKLDAVNPKGIGTKAGLRYDLTLAAGETQTILLRLSSANTAKVPWETVEETLHARRAECEQFYRELSPGLPPEEAEIHNQALAGLLWSKQYYHYNVADWLDGDPLQPPPPEDRKKGRNRHWRHFHAAEVLSMPDSWEYPWFAAWDLAFHCIPLALVDPALAKNQLLLLLREWYMHPNGQIPAYEWSFDDVNPPVHAWAAWRVYTIERRATGKADRAFLERVFHKLLMNFTWWVNRKDPQGNNVFEGGFLGLDNIGVFDRSAPLPDGSYIEQSDGTSWMAMFSLNMLTIALELAREEPAYEDVASKFLEHFFYIAEAMNDIGEDGVQLWDEDDGFYYDVLYRKDEPPIKLRVRSVVGLIPLFAVTNLDPDVAERFPAFWSRMDWFLRHRPEMMNNVASVMEPGVGERKVLSLVTKDRLRRILLRMLDPEEFLSPYGLRSLSRKHQDQPYNVRLDGHSFTVDYEPGESRTGSFGGNSNWRGPIWFPVNYLMIESLQRLDFYSGADLKVEMPTGSGNEMTLKEVAAKLEFCLLDLFKHDGQSRPNVADSCPGDTHETPLLLFHEYFDGDSGRGLGASHQTGWTALIAKVIQQVFVTAPVDV